MSFSKFFSPSGRIGRKTFWGITLLNSGIYIILALIIGFAVGATGNYETQEQEDALMGFIVLLGLPFSWIGIVTSVKRFHDMDRRGWWFLIGFIPFLGGWILLGWLGIGKGSVGQNRFGSLSDGSPFLSEQQIRELSNYNWEPPV